MALSLQAMKFHQRLTLAREAVDLSQTELGEDIGAAQSTVATWERGKNEPDLATIRRIAKRTNRTPEWLAFEVGDSTPPDTIAMSEIDVRAHSGAGGLQEIREDDETAVLRRYFFPRAEFRSTFGADPAGVRVLEAVGDSMLGTISPGEKVFVNVEDRVPSPPGIFVVWDGAALVLKRVEYVPNSEPPKVTISSDNPRYKPYDRLVEEAYIQGRVIGSWQRR